jgi:hypothetical protein
VNVTFVPVQIVPVGFAVILTLAAAGAVMLIVTELDVAGDPDTHVAFEVITHVITSLFAKAVDV